MNKKFFKALLKRLKEPSTYAGLAGLALIAGVSVEQFQLYTNTVAGIFGFMSIILGERTS